jgi:hypothetical protein
MIQDVVTNSGLQPGVQIRNDNWALALTLILIWQLFLYCSYPEYRPGHVILMRKEFHRYL